MEKIKGISFEDWACASANIAQGLLPIGQVLDILGVSTSDWEEANKAWGEKMAQIFIEQPEIASRYAEIYSNPQVAKFADVDAEYDEDEEDEDDWEDKDINHKYNNSDIKSLMREANALQHNPEQAAEVFKQAISLIEQEDDEDYEYDNLYAHYFVMKYHESKTQEPEHCQQAIIYAEKCLALLEDDINAGNIWHFTDLGAFQEEVIRISSNIIAWNKMKASDDEEELEEALSIIDLGCDYVDEDNPYFFMFDTKVRILMKLDQVDEAYDLVFQVLSYQPDFSDFEDIKQSEDYNKWLLVCQECGKAKDKTERYCPSCQEEFEDDDDDDDDDW